MDLCEDCGLIHAPDDECPAYMLRHTAHMVLWFSLHDAPWWTPVEHVRVCLREIRSPHVKRVAREVYADWLSEA